MIFGTDAEAILARVGDLTREPRLEVAAVTWQIVPIPGAAPGSVSYVPWAVVEWRGFAGAEAPYYPLAVERFDPRVVRPS